MTGLRRTSSALLCAGMSAALLLTMGAAPVTAQDEVTTTPIPAGAWLERLNALRSSYGSPPVTEDASLSSDLVAHMRYMANTGQLSHSEDPASPFYSEAGHRAGMRSVLTASSYSWPSGVEVVDSWLDAPFHLQQMLSGELAQTGYAGVTGGRGYGSYGGVDTLSKRGVVQPSTAFPKIWPPAGPVDPAVPRTYGGTESPDPLATCAGYVAPSGMPMWLETDPNVPGPQSFTAQVRNGDGTTLESCTVHSPGQRYLLVMPRLPFSPGGTYTTTWAYDGRSVERTLTVPRLVPSIWMEEPRGYFDEPLEVSVQVDARDRGRQVADGGEVTLHVSTDGSAEVALPPRPVVQGVATFTHRFSGPSTVRATYAGNASTAPGEVAATPVSLSPAPPPEVHVYTSAVEAGQPVTVHYAGVPHATLDVLARTQPATAFSKVATVVLDEYGYGESTHRPQKNTRITARDARGRLSPQAPVLGVYSVASFNATRVGTRTYTFSGRVYPARDQRLVSLYRNGVLVAQGRTGADGIYRITRTLAGGGFTFYAKTFDDTHNLGAFSRELGVYVR